MLFDRLNPLAGDVASRSAAMTAEDARAGTEKAAAAFLVWSSGGPNAPRACLMKAATELEARADAFAEAMMGEIGATEGWARFNLVLAAYMVREAASITTEISGEVIPCGKPGCIAMALREPVGVILGVRAIAVPLACGNPVVLKASEICPLTHMLIVEAFAAAGFPDGTIGGVTIPPEDAGDMAGALIEHPPVRRKNFAGSTRAGRIIARRAAEHLKPCLLELGGKAQLTAFGNPDLDEAVKAAAFSAYKNPGQICMSTERNIVADAVAEEFVERFAAKAASLASGGPREGRAPLGAAVDTKTVTHANQLICNVRKKGAAIVAGGEAETALVPATVVDRVTDEMEIYRGESFGPVLAVIRARDEVDAIRLENDPGYSLSASVFTRDTARGHRIARQIRSGICHVNAPTVHDEAQMPFAGVGASGYGRFGGRAGIDQFTQLRWITVETRPGQLPVEFRQDRNRRVIIVRTKKQAIRSGASGDVSRLFG